LTALIAAVAVVFGLGWVTGRILARGHIPAAIGLGLVSLSVAIYVAICLATG
jgi:hypothetical protein